MAEKEKKRGRSRLGGLVRRRREATEGTADPAARVQELQEELFRLRFQFATRQLTNTARIRQVRREVARQKTLQRQQELAGEAAARQ